MARLDFSALNKLSCAEFETVEEQAGARESDTLLQAAGAASEPLPACAPIEPPPGRETPQRAKMEAFYSASGTINYKKVYRAAHDFHLRNHPPTVDLDYWKEHTPGRDNAPQSEAEYWERACTDMRETAAAYGDPPLLNGLLMAIYEELAREYDTLRNEASGGGNEGK